MRYIQDGDLCSTKKFIEMHDDQERVEYLKSLYNGKTPKVIAIITGKVNNIIFAEINYIVHGEDCALESPRFFSDCIGYKMTINTYPLTAEEHMRNYSLEIGSYIISEIRPCRIVYMESKRTFFEGCGVLKKMSLQETKAYDLSDADIIFFVQEKHNMLLDNMMSKILEKIDYEKKKDEYDKKCRQYEKDMASIVDEKVRLEQELEQVRQKYKDAEEKICKEIKEKKKKKTLELERSLEKYKKKLSFYESCVEKLFEELNDEKDTNTKLSCVKKGSIKGYLNETQALLEQNHNLIYDMDTIFSFYVALQSDQMILLVGNPGSGKSSLARSFPKIFGFNDTVFIPVQSNWDSKNSLLGYYNPIDKKFMPEIFLSELVRLIHLANINKEKLFFVCLEEMNIARVEHYFAEFLSILQGDRKLRLYPKDIYNEIKAEIERYENTPQDEKSLLDKNIHQQQIENKKEMLLLYHQEIEIPRNIKFIGTLNQDETTLDLSPKVLNRSFIIRMNGNGDIILKNNEKQGDKHILEYKKFGEFKGADNKSIEQYDIAIQTKMKNFMSYRLQEQFMKQDIINKWNEVGYLNKYFDSVIAATILPSISASDEQEYQKTIEDIKSLLVNITNENTISRNIFNQMNHQEEKEIYYWEK